MMLWFKKLLKTDGIIMYEDPYLGDIVEKTSYDQIYDEHVFYFSVTSVSNLFEQHDLEVVDVVPQNVHGGSMRYIISHKGKKEISKRVNAQRLREIELGLHLPDTYTDWLNIGMTSDGDYGDKAGGSAYIGSTLMMDIRALNDGTGGIVDGSDYVYLNGVWVNDENWTQSTITDDTQLGSIPAKYLLEYVIFQETAGNAATLDLGTTSGASDVFLNQVVAASTWTTITVPNAYSITGATTLFLNDDDGSSDWNSASVNVYLVFKKFAE